jgi:hypothetical protein
MMLMNSEDIQRALDDVFDQAIVFHCFTDYMRDYEIITYSVADPRRLSQLSWWLRCVAAVEGTYTSPGQGRRCAWFCPTPTSAQDARR